MVVDNKNLWLYKWLYNFFLIFFYYVYLLIILFLLYLFSFLFSNNIIINFFFTIDNNNISYNVINFYNLLNIFFYFFNIWNFLFVYLLSFYGVFLYLLFFCIFFICFLCINKYNINFLRFFSNFIFNFFNLYLLCFLLLFSKYKYFFYYIKLEYYFFNLFNLNIIFGFDSISLLFVWFTSFLFVIAFLCSLNNIKYKFKLFIFNLLCLKLLIVLCFLSISLFWFYIFFELSLIPMFFIIVLWGSKVRKIYAFYQFLFFTLVGSLCFFIALFLLYINFFTFDWLEIINYSIINNYYYKNYNILFFIWLFIFLGFSFKIPLVPFHIWLPEAHVEAPTSGSIILAGILLKLGTYGFFRFLLPISPFYNYVFLPFIYTLCLGAIFYISFIILLQIDLKKIVAYSSILHMNFIILGLFSFNINGILGSLLLMISHGLVSSGLFACVGFLYDRYKSRNLLYYSGLVHYMPIFSVFFFIFILSNLGFPLTGNFISELLISLGLVEQDFFLVIMINLSIFISSSYFIWFFNKMIFGNNIKIYQVSDLSEREFFILLILFILILFIGIRSNFLLYFLEFSSYFWLEYYIY